VVCHVECRSQRCSRCYRWAQGELLLKPSCHSPSLYFGFFNSTGSAYPRSRTRALHTMTAGQVSFGLTRSAVQPSRSFMATSSDSRHPCAVKRKRTRFDVPKTSHRSTYWRNPWPRQARWRAKTSCNQHLAAPMDSRGQARHPLAMVAN